ncbi:hypothetical protein [Haloarchaeobius sp. TZWWS8]|uniref:hypothetical protein n=1 Tax=Haloarchaeobius sp. TZWWS8 TaxID=3446121 RepID=UPI003EBFBD3A
MSLTDAQQETTFARLENALEEYGEVMIRTASGEEGELHLHTVEFEDEPYMKVEAEDKTRWVNTEFVETFWIHEDY